MFSRLAIIVSLTSLVAADSTVLGCLSADATTSGSGLTSAPAKTADECATACLDDNAWFSAFDASSSTCLCSPSIPAGMVRGSHGCNGAGHTVSVIRPSLISSLVHATTKNSGSRRNSSAKPNREASGSLCSSGLTACNLKGGSGYACLDVASDALSCGGCRFGEYGVSSVPTSTDCSTMTGAARDSAECVQGSCFAWACQKGHRLLSDGTCVWI